MNRHGNVGRKLSIKHGSVLESVRDLSLVPFVKLTVGQVIVKEKRNEKLLISVKFPDRVYDAQMFHPPNDHFKVLHVVGVKLEESITEHVNADQRQFAKDWIVKHLSAKLV
jgi:hypothetical protein